MSNVYIVSRRRHIELRRENRFLGREHSSERNALNRSLGC